MTTRSTRVALLDYGMGNLHSAAKALEYVGATVDVTNDPKIIDRADKIVFPGVGAMRDCMAGMHEVAVDEAVKRAVFNKPVFAICVGMQALMQHAEENGGVDCLNIFKGNVVRFPERLSTELGLKVPHMGWNEVQQADPAHPLWKDIAQNSRFYFVHSYFVQPGNPDLVAATCNYGDDFCAALSQENLFATQFHPEKSHTVGLQLMKNFVEWKI